MQEQLLALHMMVQVGLEIRDLILIVLIQLLAYGVTLPRELRRKLLVMRHITPRMIKVILKLLLDIPTLLSQH